MEKKTFYTTTPIYYPSGQPHIGHNYCTMASDAIAHYKRLQGYDVMFLTGTDEYGQKVENNAKKEGVTPKEYVDKVVEGFRNLWKPLDISSDRFIRTMDDYHEKAVQKIFRALYDKGEVYKGKYKGWYCTSCEVFWTETQSKDGKCPDCGREIKWAKEEAYFFRLSNYVDKLLKLYEDQPDFIQPESRKNEVTQFIKNGPNGLCVSCASLSWGIPVDFDPKHVVYVQPDAPTNYTTATGYGSDDDPDYHKYWPADVHFIGKEIARFHAIIQPAILMAMDLLLSKQVYGRGWLLSGDGSKMSKSKGNVVNPVVLCDRYGVDAIRYFLLHEIPFGADGNFTSEALISRTNSDLVNDLGNSVSRTTAMVGKYFGGVIPAEQEKAPVDGELEQAATTLREKCDKAIDSYQFSSALTEIWKVIACTNKYIDETAPWVFGKDESQEVRLASVVYHLCEALRVISILITPFVPNTVPRIQEQLNAGTAVPGYESAAAWDLLPADAVITKGETLFPCIDVDKEIEELNQLIPSTVPAQGEKKDEETAAQTPEGIAQVTIDDFMKVELVVAKMLSCEHTKRAKKLLKFTLDGGTGERAVVSGIVRWYQPEDLIGHSIVLIKSLRPVMLCDVESQGTILPADCGEDTVCVLLMDDIPIGSRIHQRTGYIAKRLTSDSHTHYDDEAFDFDREELLQHLPEQDVCNVMSMGADYDGCREALELASRYSYIYAAMGIHPENAAGLPEDYLSQIEKWSNAPKVVAIGEIGLDHHYEDMAPREVQRKVFEDQILLAKRWNLPTVIHDREAHGDTMEILHCHRPRDVVHCFSGSTEVTCEVVELGMYIGPGGVIIFKNARVAVEMAREISLDRLLTETDASHLAPEPFRGKRCDSSMIHYVAQRITEIRGITANEVLAAGRRNAEALSDIVAEGQCNLTITYVVEKDHLYVNMTNRCPNACGFYVRSFNERKEGEADLQLECEPTREEILEQPKSKSLNSYRELISCGYGKSTYRFDDLAWLCQQVRQMSRVNVRLNTNGLSDLINRHSTAPKLDGLLDSVSISLNASTPEKYQEICHSKLGLEVLLAVLKLAKTIGLYVPKVYMTVVDNMPREEISAYEKLYRGAGATFRVYEFLDHQSYVEE